jgi:hypothetical protein
MTVAHATNAEIQTDGTAYFSTTYVGTGDMYTNPESLTLDI